MKNKVLVVFLSIIFFQPLMAENLNIQSSEIFIDKKSSLTIFKGDVVATDYKNTGNVGSIYGNTSNDVLPGATGTQPQFFYQDK